MMIMMMMTSMETMRKTMEMTTTTMTTSRDVKIGLGRDHAVSNFGCVYGLVPKLLKWIYSEQFLWSYPKS